MPHTYLAVTIGPIVKTLTKARSTKEVWAASYLISYLMKQLVSQFKDTHTFISPLATKPELFKPQGGAGLFPDRLIFKQKDESDFIELIACIEQIVKDLVCGKENKKGIAAEINDQLKVDHYTISKKERTQRNHWEIGAKNSQILTYFQQYLKIYALEITLGEGANVREKIDQHLNSLELQSPLQLPEQTDYVAALFRGVYGRKLEGSLLLEDGFGPNYQRPFPSLFEIATNEFTHNKKRATEYNTVIKDWLEKTKEQTRQMIKTGIEPLMPDPDATLLQKVKTLMGDDFRRRHKYIAIVHGDGDGMGNLNAAIFSKNRSTADTEALLADVDGRLFRFSLDAIRTIQAFGGCPIYLGGDDLIFFAPIMGYIDEEPASVFKLVKILSASFDGQFSDDAYRQKLDVRLTLSFGVSITYHKYPMFEALDAARHLLEQDAKGIAGKNAVAFKVLKNSQQAFGTTYSKNAEEGVFNKHVSVLLNHVKGTDNAFLTSVQHVLMGQQIMLCAIIAKDITRLTNFFVNNFDEAVHDEKRTFLVDVASMLSEAYKETQDGEKAIEMAHATLRFIQFLHQPDLDDDE